MPWVFGVRVHLSKSSLDPFLCALALINSSANVWLSLFMAALEVNIPPAMGALRKDRRVYNGHHLEQWSPAHSAVVVSNA